MTCEYELLGGGDNIRHVMLTFLVQVKEDLPAMFCTETAYNMQTGVERQCDNTVTGRLTASLRLVRFSSQPTSASPQAFWTLFIAPLKALTMRNKITCGPPARWAFSYLGAAGFRAAGHAQSLRSMLILYRYR